MGAKKRTGPRLAHDELLGSRPDQFGKFHGDVSCCRALLRSLGGVPDRFNEVRVAGRVHNRYLPLAAGTEQLVDSRYGLPCRFSTARPEFFDRFQGFHRPRAGKGQNHIDDKQGGFVAETLALTVTGFLINSPIEIRYDFFPFSHNIPPLYLEPLWPALNRIELMPGFTRKIPSGRLFVHNFRPRRPFGPFHDHMAPENRHHGPAFKLFVLPYGPPCRTIDHIPAYFHCPVQINDHKVRIGADGDGSLLRIETKNPRRIFATDSHQLLKG